MKPFRGYILSLFCVLLAMPSAMAGDVTSVRFGEHEDFTRIVIETDKPVTFRAYTLSDPVSRLVISFDTAGWSVEGLESGFGLGPEGLGVFRFDSQAMSPRLIFDLENPYVIRDQMVLDPSNGGYRNVIDIAPVEQKAFAEVSGFPSDEQTLSSFLVHETGIEFAPPSCEAVRVVIDPGHGGKDSGATARFGGGHEKDVNLAAGLALRDLLQATGRYEVIMTRDRDVFVELMDRVKIARQAEADLFISLHADSAGKNRAPKGATVFSMNHHAISRARKRAIRDGDWVDQSRPQEVSRILVEMSLTNKQGESERFAQSLRNEIGQVAPLWRDTAMQANFAVLTDASVPAVLLEMGFLTNRSDARRINSKTERDKLMRAVQTSIDSQFAYCGGGQRRPSYVADNSAARPTR